MATRVRASDYLFGFSIRSNKSLKGNMLFCIGLLMIKVEQALQEPLKEQCYF